VLFDEVKGKFVQIMALPLHYRSYFILLFSAEASLYEQQTASEEQEEQGDNYDSVNRGAQTPLKHLLLVISICKPFELSFLVS